MENLKKINKTSRFLLFLIILLTVIICFVRCVNDKPNGHNNPSGKISSSMNGSNTTIEEPSSDEEGSSSEGDRTDGSSSAKNGNTSSTSSKKPPVKKTTTTTNPAGTTSSYYCAPKVYSNSAPGVLVAQSTDGTAVIDYSNTKSGYVMVKYSGSTYSNIRTQVKGPNNVTQTYPIFSKNFEALPLTGGSGTYTIYILGNNGGTSYSLIANVDIDVALSYSTVAFSRPNVIVNYSSSTACVQYAATLTKGFDSEIKRVENIYNYVVRNFKYDYAKAGAVASSAYVPDLNSVWASKSGICYDYAAVMTAMLRTQGFPTKVQVGYANSQYHAWISVYTKEAGWVNGIIQFNGTSWKLMDPTFSSTGGDADWSKKYNYSVLYLY
ncbi:MAG: transglutaminase domain-containing protein [Ruminococcaceae bacterium]|nr:transglutaminase domain-containing protein [Oscillospiraceae bacterium]